MEPTKRESLAKTGHYRNLTYETFLLPLLSERAGLAQPKKVKHFLLDFRYQVERQLNFPSAAPTATMYQKDIAELLLKDASLLQAAYELPNALKAVENRLKKQLGADVLKVSAELQVPLASSPDDWEAFECFANMCPASFAKPSSGSYSIGLEFSGPTLDVRVCGGGKNSPVGQELMKRLGDTQGNRNWACWASLYHSDWKSLYVDVATGVFATKLRSRLTTLCHTLDALQRQGLLSA